MFYTDIGQGEPLVFIHGLGSKKEAWNYQHELSNKYRLIIPDLRGHGESEEYNDISISTFAQDILSLLDSLNIKKAHFCGLSMGGLVVQELYLQQPDCFISMILSNTFSYTSLLMGQMVLNLQIDHLNKMIPDEYLFHTSKNCLYSNDSKLINEAKELFLIKRDAYIASSSSAIKCNYLFMLPFVKVPTLVIGSSHDQVIPLISLYQTKLFIPNSRLVVLDNCGHLSNFEKKDEYNELLYDFLCSTKK